MSHSRIWFATCISFCSCTAVQEAKGPSGDVSGTTRADAATGSVSDDSAGTVTSATVATGTGVVDATAPVLRIDAPGDGRMTAVRQIEVVGHVADDVQLGALHYLGRSGEEPIAVAKNGTFSRRVELVPGPNVITLRAVDAAGNEVHTDIDVYYGHRVAVGNSQVAFLREGTLYTWGRNELGQLGNGTLDGSGYGDDPQTASLPARYALDVSGLVSVVTRQTFMIALRDDGRVMTWGSNAQGQLGYDAELDCGSDGMSPCSRTPTVVPGIDDAVAVQAGFGHALVLREDGTVASFGSNDRGQLGALATSDMADVVQLAAGASSSFALTASGEVYAWGDNAHGQLGLGSADTSTHAVPVVVPGLSGVTAVAAANTTAYAVLDDGTMRAWGRNHVGQAGTGDDTGADVLSPMPVVDASGQPLRGVDAVAADGFVAMAVTRDLEVYAWGAGNLGQLGQGYDDDGERDLEDRFHAAKVVATDAEPFRAIEVEVGAGGPAMALTADGHLFGWGWSFRGSLGLPGAIDAWAYTAPVLVFSGR